MKGATKEGNSLAFFISNNKQKTNFMKSALKSFSMSTERTKQ
jgi:hypothetical protein